MVPLKYLFALGLLFSFTSFLATKLYLVLVGRGLAVHIFNHYPGKCRIIPGIECGSEDVAVTKDGLAFVSSGYRGITGCDLDSLTGRLYIFDFDNPAANVSMLEIVSEDINMKEFEPHGLSLWETKNGTYLLFVVDHGVSERVQIFEYNRKNPTQLIHRRTIIDKEFICLNDLVVVNENSFYITNYLKYCKVSKPLTYMEGLLTLRTGNVVYYDGNKGRIAAANVAMANGINMSPDGSFVFVTGSMAQSLYVFSRDINNGSLTLVREFGLNTMPDNVEIDRETGDLYLGCHRNQYLLLGDYDGILAAPTQALRIHPEDQQWKNIKITEVLSSDGHDFIRGSSVAHYRKSKILIGTVFHRLALCEDVHIY
eukprot:gene9148-10121_t